MSDRPIARAYVDGYNLYYGLRKSCGRGESGWRWLDIPRLIRRAVPEYQLDSVVYFTARIKPETWAKAKRQKRLLRALRTCENLEFVYGRYRSDPQEFPLVADPETMVEVLHTEEKETDVNMATRLIFDTLLHDEAPRVGHVVVVSNDSDQVAPIKLLRERGVTVGILNPHLDRPSAELRKVASWVRPIRPRNVFGCQFPDELADNGGTFQKPPSW